MASESKTAPAQGGTAKLLAALFLALVLAGLAVRFHAAGQASSIYGPTHVTAGSRGVFLLFSNELHRFSTQGRWLGSVTIESLGVQESPIDLVALADGRLGEIQRLGGRGERSALGHLDKGAQCSDFHYSK